MGMQMGEFFKGFGLFAYYLFIPWGVLVIGSWYCALPSTSPGMDGDVSKVQLSVVVTARKPIQINDKISEDDIEVSMKRVNSDQGENVQFPGKVIGRTVSELIKKGDVIPTRLVSPMPIQLEKMVSLLEDKAKKLGAIVVSTASVAALVPGMKVNIVRVIDGAEKVKLAESCEKELATEVTVMGLVALSSNDKKAALLFDRTRISDQCFESFTTGQHIPIPARW